MGDAEIQAFMRAYNAQRQPQSQPAAPASIETQSPKDYAHAAMMDFWNEAAQSRVPIDYGQLGKAYNDAYAKAESYQASLAEKEHERQFVTPEESEKFQASRNAWDVLNQIEAAFKNLPWSKGPLLGFASPALAAVGSPELRSYNTLIHLARPILNAGITHEGKAQFGEASQI